MPSFTVTIDSDTFLFLYNEAQRRGCSVTKLMSEIIKEHVKAMKAGAKP
jgi:hypothetical protein